MAELWFGCFEYYHAYRSGNTFNECLCGYVGAKSVGHLMKFHLLQWEVVKVKFLMNSNMQQDFKGQGHYNKVKGQIMVTA